MVWLANGGGLLPQPRVVHAVNEGRAVVEGGVGSGPACQRGDLFVRAYVPQAVQQERHANQAKRVVEGDVGGRIAGQQRGGLLSRARF
jgi:hypothetical protein